LSEHPENVYAIASSVSNSEIIFQSTDGQVVGKLFLEHPMRFEGDADEAAKLFFDAMMTMETRSRTVEALAMRIERRDKKIAKLQRQNKSLNKQLSTFTLSDETM
jgi:hypothetical protein